MQVPTGSRGDATGHVVKLSCRAGWTQKLSCMSVCRVRRRHLATRYSYNFSTLICDFIQSRAHSTWILWQLHGYL